MAAQNPPPPLFKRTVEHGGWRHDLVSLWCLFAARLRGLRVLQPLLLLSVPWRRLKVVSWSIDADTKSSTGTVVADVKSSDAAIVADLESSDGRESSWWYEKRETPRSYAYAYTRLSARYAEWHQRYVFL